MVDILFLDLEKENIREPSTKNSVEVDHERFRRFVKEDNWRILQPSQTTEIRRTPIGQSRARLQTPTSRQRCGDRVLRWDSTSRFGIGMVASCSVRSGAL